MEKIVWSQQMVLGIPTMDEAHKAFFDALAHLETTLDEELAPSLFALIAVMERDFQQEEAMMEEIDFPALRSHREQHARVLGALHHIVPEVMHGDCRSARRAIELLPQWFSFHLSTMDATLAVALDLASLQTKISVAQVAQADTVRLLHDE